MMATSMACAPTEGEAPVLVFAAASLADALGDVETEFESVSEAQVDISFGGSQMLAQQIASGAPADVFISAGQAPVDFLVDKDLVAGGTGFLTNRLVLAVNDGLPIEITSLAQLKADVVERVAIADPDLAPAGGYAKQALLDLGLWKSLEAKLIFGPDVRTTLAYVETGNADVAVVYATDAAVAEGVVVADVVPAGSYDRAVYPSSVIATTENRDAAEELLDFLRGEEAAAIFRRHGFEPYE